MKKPTPSQSTTSKLPLRTTTVRKLESSQLERVAGGDCCASCGLTCHGNNVTR